MQPTSLPRRPFTQANRQLAPFGKHLPNVSGFLTGLGAQTPKSQGPISLQASGESEAHVPKDKHLGGERWARHEVRGRGTMPIFDKAQLSQVSGTLWVSGSYHLVYSGGDTYGKMCALWKFSTGHCPVLGPSQRT